MRRTLLLLAGMLLLAGCDLAPWEQVDNILTSIVNIDRQHCPAPPLGLDHDVTWAAQARAQDLAQPGGFHHAFDQHAGIPLRYTIIDENIGHGTVPSQGFDEIEAQFMASPDHRANICDLRTAVGGVGIYIGADGLTYVDEIFVGP